MDLGPVTLGPDKGWHAGAGFACGLAGVAIVDRLWPSAPAHPIARRLLALLPAAIAGAAKEAFDAAHPKTHTADPWDFAATVAGGVIGVELAARTFAGVAVRPEPEGGAAISIVVTLRR